MKSFTEKRRCLKQKFHPKRQSAQWVAWSLGIFLFCTQSVNAQTITSACRPQFVLPEPSNVNVADLNGTCKDSRQLVTTPQGALSELAQADVVYLGETHDSPQDHQAQLEIIQELQQRNSKIAIAMEMFQRPYQDVLDHYIAGELSEQELLAQSEYEQRWGFPWEYYAPILRFAKEKQLPVLALNTPTEVTRKVASEGLKSLTRKQRQFIPPFSEVLTDNDDYRKLMLTAFKRHQGAVQGSSDNFERFFLAQVLWDETMAERIAQFLQVNPDYQVVVLAGQGHIFYGYGIPNRVARRLKDEKPVQRSVLFNPPEDAAVDKKKPIADFVWEHR